MRLLTTPVLIWLALGFPALAVVESASSAATDSSADVQVREGTSPDGLLREDWDGIRAAHDAARHAVHASEEGYRARNPGQAWLTRFDGRGFQLEPDSGAWSWGLELQSYGFAGSEIEPTAPPRARVDGGRIAYDWGAALEEWYINDGRGLEHGYTLQQRPPRSAQGDGGPLTFTLVLRGDLRPEVARCGRSVRFLDWALATVLTYSGLTVFDARGQALEASFSVSGRQLTLSIDERDALYPLTVDPIAQQAYLKASNTDASDFFGAEVAVYGDTVVVGASLEDSAATGVNGDQSDDSASSAGAVYVFRRSGTSWAQEAYLKSSNTDPGDHFGCSVAISGDTLVVGAYGESSNAMIVGGDQTNNSRPNSGAAYVFVRSGTVWAQEAYLKPSNAGTGDYFGVAAAISGDTLVIGAPLEDSNSTGVNGDQNNGSASAAGAAYVFQRNGATWSQEAYLKASNTQPDVEYGSSVSVSGDTAVVGALYESSNATGVDGDQSDTSAPRAGAAYVYVRSAGTWSQDAYLKASNTDTWDMFGGAVAASGDTIVVGAVGEDSQTNQSENGFSFSGAAYVFVRTATSWSQEAFLKSLNTESNDKFGGALSVSGDTIVVGAIGEASIATGPNGDASDNSSPVSGAAYVFRRAGTNWSQSAYLKASNSDAFDFFGESVWVFGDTVVVGADSEASIASGVNGDQADNSAPGAGAAYVLDLDMPDLSGTPFCFGDGTGNPCPCAGGGLGAGCPNSATSGAILAGTGNPQLTSDTFTLTLSGLPAAKAGLCVKGSSLLGGGNGNVVGDGLLCIGPEKRSQVLVSDAVGGLTMGSWRGQSFGAFPGAANIGAPTYYQWWYRDPGNTCSGQGFNFSNAWAATWLP